MMADPMLALLSFQKEFFAGMPTIASVNSPNIRVFRDELNGKTRFSYARVEQGQVRSLAMFVSAGTYNGVPCFDIGYAVATPWRGGGYAKEILAQGIKELSEGLCQATGLSEFWIVAVIGVENYASQSVAKSALSDAPEKILDELSGLPALVFRRLISVESRTTT
ncbi:GNAT family N-acetyltransferase [Pseudomonas sp. MPG01]